MQETISKLNGRVRGEIQVPGDKSISHRSIILGSIAEGITEVNNFLTGEDCICTMQAFQELGVKIELNANQVTIHGQGFQALEALSQDIYLGNSGTAMRLLAGLFAGLPFSTTLTGDQSLSSRPMQRVIDPLSQMGAKISSNEGRAPLTIEPSKLNHINYDSPIASAQVKSSILLAALNADGITTISEPHKSRDHTERMLANFGADIKVDGLSISLDASKSQQLIGQSITVPSDISSAAFILVAGAILPDAELKLLNVGINPTRAGILEVFTQMSVDYDLLNTRDQCGEPVADIIIKSSHPQATTIGEDLIPRLIDEIPIISILAAQAQGRTVIKDAAELKVKESNRIATTVNLLEKLGVEVEETEDGMVIEGRANQEFEPLDDPTIIDSHGDHRLAMSAAIAALHSHHPIQILQTEYTQTSFPGFFDLLQSLRTIKTK